MRSSHRCRLKASVWAEFVLIFVAFGRASTPDPTKYQCLYILSLSLGHVYVCQCVGSYVKNHETSHCCLGRTLLALVMSQCDQKSGHTVTLRVHSPNHTGSSNSSEGPPTCCPTLWCLWAPVGHVVTVLWAMFLWKMKVKTRTRLIGNFLHLHDFAEFSIWCRVSKWLVTDFDSFESFSFCCQIRLYFRNNL